MWLADVLVCQLLLAFVVHGDVHHALTTGTDFPIDRKSPAEYIINC